MLHLIPAAWHRAGLRLAHELRVRWWRIRKPLVFGCRVLAFDAAGRILLIRHSYGTEHWMLPGGGLSRGEDPVAAALRELREETGCELAEARLFSVVDEPLFGATNRVHLVTGLALGVPAGDGREVTEARFFAAGALPDGLSHQLQTHLDGWITAAKAGPGLAPGE